MLLFKKVILFSIFVTGQQDAIHITAILGESVIFNCHVEFPGDHPVPYVLQWEKKVSESVRYFKLSLHFLMKQKTFLRQRDSRAIYLHHKYWTSLLHREIEKNKIVFVRRKKIRNILLSMVFKFREFFQFSIYSFLKNGTIIT